MDPQLKENPTSPSEGSSEPPHSTSEDAQETLVPAEPSEATPTAPIEQGAHETTDTKKIKKKESNATYYKKIRERPKQADVSTLEPEPVTPPKPPKVPKARAKPKAAKQSSESEPLQRLRTPPVSPRTRMIEAYREARLADQERKRLRYKSWFQ
jgi:hypothetical protein